jgi:DNA (cytosine-5)-methyltransferase 1
MISTQEAANQLKCTPQHTRELIRKGVLKGKKIKGRWMIDPASLNQEKERRGIISNTTPLKSYSSMNALSFFSGAMGLDIGLKQAGFEVCLASEIDKHTISTIRANLPELPIIGDVRNYQAKDILSISGFESGENIDLIVGGPPCQAFSTAGKRLGFNDERGNVFLHFVDLICTLRPKFAVIENVRGLLSAPLVHRPHNQRGRGFPALTHEERPGGALKEIVRRFKKAGFSVSFNLYNAAIFGTPQVRERVVIICSRDGTEVPYLCPTHSDNSTYGLKPLRTFREATQDITEHEFIEFPEKRKRFYEMLGPGQNWRDLPPEMQKEAMGQSYYSSGGRTGFLRRISWDKPSPTLVTHPAMPATDLAHPEELRPLSVQEYKRVQDFPDDWVIAGKTLHKYRQLGNAVPVGLGKAIGFHLQQITIGSTIPKPDPNFRYSRYLGCDHHTWLRKNNFEEEGQQLSLAM